MSKNPHHRLKKDEIPESACPFEVDLGYLFSDDKELKSIKVIWDGLEFWLAEHNVTGQYWTTNTNDPKILNTVKTPPRPRGNVMWKIAGGNPSGKPKGSKNRVSVKQACDRMGCNPAEFLAAVVTGNVGELKRHRIRNPQEVTIAQKMKAAEILLNKLVPNLKPAGLDENGDMLPEKEVNQDDRSQIQVYIPSSGNKISISATKEEAEEIEAGVADFMQKHEKETIPYDSENEEEELVWRLDDTK